MGQRGNLQALFSEIDGAIRAGKGKSVRALLLGIKTKIIPREAKREFARLCRRAHLNSLALKVLNPLVRPSGAKVSVATEEEKAEYAAALTYVGATKESREILRSLKAESNPEILLLHSFALFAEWRYAEAIPLLESYVENPGLTEYARLIGRTNLASALVHEHHGAAEKVLAEIFRSATPLQNSIVYGYALKLVAERAVLEKKWAKAKDSLEKAKAFFPSTDSLEALFIQKWQAIVALYEDPKRGAGDLEKIKAEALRLRHWETIRSSDFHLALATRKVEVVQRFLLGTPFEALKQKLLAEIGQAVSLPDHYDWELVPGRHPLILPLSALLKETHGKMKPGQTLYRLLCILCTDFYRPFRSAELHAKLYENEYFNPVTSPHRVVQLVSRLRTLLKEEKSPLQIQIVRNYYSLTSQKACTVRLASELKPEASPSLRIKRLHIRIGGVPFSIHEACRALELPLWTVKRLLKEAQTSGGLVRAGAGNQIRYQFVGEETATKRGKGR